MSPRSKAQFEELRGASVKKILDASLELFGTVGYETTSIAQIAKKAGISKGLIYNYFSSKEDLVRAIINQLTKEGEDIIYGQLSDDPRKSLEMIFRLTFKWLRENQHLNRLIFSLIMQVDKFDFVHQLAVTKMQEYLLILENFLEKMNFPDCKTEARLLATIFDGIGVQYMVLKDNYPLDEIEKMLIEKYCS